MLFNHTNCYCKNVMAGEATKQNVFYLINCYTNTMFASQNFHTNGRGSPSFRYVKFARIVFLKQLNGVSYIFLHY